MTLPLRLSVLDQSVARAGRPQDESIRQTVALAERCEALGFHRFWLSEHHGLPTIVGSAPEILMASVLRRRLGVSTALAMIVAEVMGVGIFLTPAGMARTLNTTGCSSSSQSIASR